MRPIFCGNFEYDARQSDLERLFRRYGKVDRVDMKSGFAFVYMEDERDAEDAIRALDRMEFGRKGRRLRVEWTKQERSSRRPESSRKSSSNLRPSKTLFVINFDPYHTRTRDLERHFDPYGKILNVRIRRNFAFIQYESQEDATKALDATNMSKLLDRVITVEYAIKDDDERRNGYSPDRIRDRSPRRGSDRVRSPSPYKRERESPDYGHGRGRSPSPYRRERASPDYVRGSNRSPSRKERDTRRGRGLSASPRKDRDSDYNHKHSPSPQRERSNGDIGAHASPGKRVSPDYGRGPSPSPQREPGERVPSPDDYARDRSPAYSDGESPRPERYGSQSPPARERSQS
ncbi:Serine/arginine-rich splicing factor RS41 [Sesamum alatum]|uniref:Serine/arginine-rich splicing factor RS41 n=1 Tax=Sesamum alatum TaxID=300844 RepID=A0AAE1YL50_9LAMI|nr:Serine/arginine-rich splicing factor RS41 [Sesamum alatum]